MTLQSAFEIYGRSRSSSVESVVLQRQVSTEIQMDSRFSSAVIRKGETKGTLSLGHTPSCRMDL